MKPLDDDHRRSMQMRRDDDDEDRIRKSIKKKKKKKANSALLWILLTGGGVLGLFGCCAVSIGGYVLFSIFHTPDIVGRGENREIIPIVYEFRADGTGQTEVMGFTVRFNYRLSGSELTITPTNVEARMMNMNLRQGMIQDTGPMRVIRDGNTLRLEESNRRGQILILRKIG